VAACAAFLALVGVAWYISSEIERGGLRAPTPGAPAAPLRIDAVIRSLEPGVVTLRDAANGSTAALRDSVWGLRTSRGWAIAGPVLATGAREATRGFHLLQGSVAPGDTIEVDRKTFPGDPLQGLHIPFEEVVVPGDLGGCPAWRIQGSGATWALFVHGKGGGRREALRALGEIADLGLPALVITYRNDPETAASPDGRYNYGLTEWKDVDAAARYAVSQGAERFILFGYSMGGGIAIRFLAESSLAPRVAGVVLDAPMLDFGETLDLGIRLKRLPPFGTPVPPISGDIGKWIAAGRFGIDWRALSMIATAERTQAPMLIFHGDADDIVPIETSRRLAVADPAGVRLVTTAGAGHVESWNAEPRRYRAELRAFVSRVLSAP
jgi:alpha-beta hydrolase superfamily lysophospholipase